MDHSLFMSHYSFISDPRSNYRCTYYACVYLKAKIFSALKFSDLVGQCIKWVEILAIFKFVVTCFSGQLN